MQGSQPRRPNVLVRRAISSPQGAVIWQDEFTQLADRVDAPPLPLPSVAASKRVVLVRHGQSTWNAEGRIQGSSDAAVLTEKGKRQAAATAHSVRGCLVLPTNSVKVLMLSAFGDVFCLPAFVWLGTVKGLPLRCSHTQPAGTGC